MGRWYGIDYGGVCGAGVCGEFELESGADTCGGYAEYRECGTTGAWGAGVCCGADGDGV